MSDNFARCGKCRYNLVSSSELLGSHRKALGDKRNCDAGQDVVRYFINEVNCPLFITKQAVESQWTKGKINCPHCGERIGSFNFTRCRLCQCGKMELPAILLYSNSIYVLLDSNTGSQAIAVSGVSTSLSDISHPLKLTASDVSSESEEDEPAASASKEIQQGSRNENLESKPEMGIEQNSEAEGEAAGNRHSSGGDEADSEKPQCVWYLGDKYYVGRGLVVPKEKQKDSISILPSLVEMEDLSWNEVFENSRLEQLSRDNQTMINNYHTTVASSSTKFPDRLSGSRKTSSATTQSSHGQVEAALESSHPTNTLSINISDVTRPSAFQPFVAEKRSSKSTLSAAVVSEIPSPGHSLPLPSTSNIENSLSVSHSLATSCRVMAYPLATQVTSQSSSAAPSRSHQSEAPSNTSQSAATSITHASGVQSTAHALETPSSIHSSTHHISVTSSTNASNAEIKRPPKNVTRLASSTHSPAAPGSLDNRQRVLRLNEARATNAVSNTPKTQPQSGLRNVNDIDRRSMPTVPKTRNERQEQAGGQSLQQGQDGLNEAQRQREGSMLSTQSTEETCSGSRRSSSENISVRQHNTRTSVRHNCNGRDVTNSSNSNRLTNVQTNHDSSAGLRRQEHFPGCRHSEARQTSTLPADASTSRWQSTLSGGGVGSATDSVNQSTQCFLGPIQMKPLVVPRGARVITPRPRATRKFTGNLSRNTEEPTVSSHSQSREASSTASSDQIGVNVRQDARRDINATVSGRTSRPTREEEVRRPRSRDPVSQGSQQRRSAGAVCSSLQATTRHRRDHQNSRELQQGNLSSSVRVRSGNRQQSSVVQGQPDGGSQRESRTGRTSTTNQAASTALASQASSTTAVLQAVSTLVSRVTSTSSSTTILAAPAQEAVRTSSRQMTSRASTSQVVTTSAALVASTSGPAAVTTSTQVASTAVTTSAPQVASTAVTTSAPQIASTSAPRASRSGFVPQPVVSQEVWRLVRRRPSTPPGLRFITVGETPEQVAAAAAKRDAEEIDSDAQCVVCYELLCSPQIMNPCGHIFCLYCVYEIKDRTLDFRCPMCRSQVLGHMLEEELERVLRRNYPVNYCYRKGRISMYEAVRNDAIVHRSNWNRFPGRWADYNNLMAIRIQNIREREERQNEEYRQRRERERQLIQERDQERRWLARRERFRHFALLWDNAWFLIATVSIFFLALSISLHVLRAFF